jgi:type I restriction enzyme S subunit
MHEKEETMIEFKQVVDVIDKPISGEWGAGVGAVRVLRTTNFKNSGELDFSNLVYRDIQSEKVIKKALIPGDTIIEKSGGSPTQPVGRVVYFDAAGTFMCNNFTSILRPKLHLVHPRFFFWFMFFNYTNSRTLPFQNRTTGIINLKLDNYLKSLQIPLPPLETQRAIAAKLDAADRLRQLDQQLLTKCDELAQAIFIDMFGDPVKNEKGWEVKELGELALPEKNSIKAGPFGSSLKKEFYVDSGYKIYGQEQVIADDLKCGNYYIDEERYNSLKSCAIKEGDLLISLVGTYGKISVVPSVFEQGIINPRLMKISLNNKISAPRFYKFLLQSEEMKTEISRFSRGGTMDIVNVGIMSKIRVIVPPLSHQTVFLEKIAFIEELKLNVKRIRTYELFDSMLKEVFKA